MDNMELYNRVRTVPKEAQKDFNNGRFRGTDINPMWRIKKLTEEFGVCGVGWYYEITDKRIDTVMSSDEIVANVEIKLYVKINGEWSKPIVGIGGSKLSSNEKKGLYVNDEMLKMALTDAISVATKQLGFGADIYWQNDNDKYIDKKKDNASEINEDRQAVKDEIQKFVNTHGMTMSEVAKDYKLNASSTVSRLKEVLADLKGSK